MSINKPNPVCQECADVVKSQVLFKLKKQKKLTADDVKYLREYIGTDRIAHIFLGFDGRLMGKKFQPKKST